MSNIFSKIFGSDNIINVGTRAIDALVFTDEEKAKLHLEFLKQYDAYKIAQRFLAVMFGGVYLVIYLYSILIWSIGLFHSKLEMQGFYMEAAFELAKWNTVTLGTTVAIIVGFYFAGGVFKMKGK